MAAPEASPPAGEDSPPGRADLMALAAEWRTTGAWMESAANFVGERIWDAEGELREAGEMIILALAAPDGRPDFPAARMRVLKARQRAVIAVISHIGAELEDIRGKVDEPLLQMRFPENRYGRFLRQLGQAAVLARAAESSDSADARDQLLAWAESELNTLRELCRDLRAAAPAMLGEKTKRDRKLRRDLGLVAAGLLIGLAGLLIGLLF